MHTVFSTECNSYFDWQSVALFYSHNQVEQPGYITRLMACDHPGHYPGLDIGPTYIHPNYGNPKNNLVQDHYTPYNKPGSLYHWLFENAQVPEADHVLVVEPDMIFRKPIDCEKELAVRPGVVASAPYSYLSGTDNGMAAQFVGAEALNRLDKVGGFYCFKMDDLRKVVPAWLNYTKAVRTNPGRYWQIEGVGSDFPTGDDYVERGHAPWISEMYGYIFGAGSVGLQHAVRDDVVLFAGLSPAYEPSLIHYGLYCQEGQRTFNKLSYKTGFSPSTCEQYFPEPASLERTHELQNPGAELICVEVIAVINEALCEYHTRTCCNYETVSYGCHNQQLRPLLRTEEACARSCCSRGDKCSHYVFGADGRCMHSHFRRGQCGEGEFKLDRRVQAGHRKIARHIECPAPSWSDVQRVQDEELALGTGVSECKDLHPECKRWEQESQCELNPHFMKTNCPTICQVEGCWDKRASCKIWAEKGQCEENFQYMLEHCPVACRQRREKQLVEKKAQAVAAHARRRELIHRTEQLKEVEQDIAEEDEADEEAAEQIGSSSQRLQPPEWQKEGVGARRAAELAEYRPAMMVTQAAEVDRAEAMRARAEQAEMARSARVPSGVAVEEEVEIAWGRVVAFAAACSAIVYYRWIQRSKSWRSHKVHVQLGKGV